MKDIDTNNKLGEAYDKLLKQVSEQGAGNFKELVLKILMLICFILLMDRIER
jgi:hypothetical protein